MTRHQFFTAIAGLFGGAWVAKGQNLSEPGPNGHFVAPAECRNVGVCLDRSGNLWVNGELRPTTRRTYRNGECPVCGTMADNWSYLKTYREVTCKNCRVKYQQESEK